MQSVMSHSSWRSRIEGGTVHVHNKSPPNILGVRRSARRFWDPVFRPSMTSGCRGAMTHRSIWTLFIRSCPAFSCIQNTRNTTTPASLSCTFADVRFQRFVPQMRLRTSLPSQGHPGFQLAHVHSPRANARAAQPRGPASLAEERSGCCEAQRKRGPAIPLSSFNPSRL